MTEQSRTPGMPPRPTEPREPATRHLAAPEPAAPQAQLRLLLLRHAQAEAGLGDDHERRLTARGVADATAIGRWLADHDLACDLVLCSTAARTRATWAAAAAGGATAAVVRHEPTLYLGGTRSVLGLLAQLPTGRRDCGPGEAGPTTVLVVGHAPTMPALAEAITDGAGQEVAVADLGHGFPTAALAVVRLHPGIDWAEIDRGTGELAAFVVGRG